MNRSASTGRERVSRSANWWTAACRPSRFQAGLQVRLSRWLLLLALLSPAVRVVAAEVSVACRLTSTPLRWAVDQLETALAAHGERLVRQDSSGDERPADIIIVADESNVGQSGFTRRTFPFDTPVLPQGFQILKATVAGRTIVCVRGGDDIGAMYGTLELAEQLRLHGELGAVEPRRENPRFPFRAIKFNLPWSPYRPGAATELQQATCRDLEFWRRFLDMMAENPFNVLTLWNLHPFPYLIRPKNFPEACPFSELELADWRRFWQTLFRLAKDRGIETYLVNWNIVVSPEFARAHHVRERNDTSEIVQRYTRECVTQVINEYPDLTGLGVTLADWMNGMTPQAREDWIEQTFVAGIHAARRPVKFIHRSVLAGDPVALRQLIERARLPDPVWVEVKFNWSHGHSTPVLAMTHDYESGKVDDRFWNPTPTHFKIAWMIRNEDFFILRWGDPEFIRRHIAQNGQAYVGGYFVGSEGSIPAKDISHRRSAHQTWQYAFQKQWLFYQLWGRLLYDPQTPDTTFAAAFDERYGAGVGNDLLRAYTLASRMPRRLASFHAATWDYTLYAEGFLAPAKSRGLFDGISPFISIDEFIQHQTLDPSLLSIPAWVETVTGHRQVPAGKVTPLQLADQSEQDGRAVLGLVSRLRVRVTPWSGPLECELDDLATWAELSLYLADKLRAGVSLQTFRVTGQLAQKQQAVPWLQKAARAWEKVVQLTQAHYAETPYVAGFPFAWANYRDQVQRDLQIARDAAPAGAVP